MKTNNLLRRIASRTSVALIAAAALTAVDGAGAARAQTTASYSVSSQFAAPVLTDFDNYALSFAKFDSSLGTLLAVNISISADITSDITLRNTAATASSGSVSTRVRMSITDPAGVFANPPFTADGGFNSGTLPLQSVTPTYNFTLNPGESLTSPTLTSSRTVARAFSTAPRTNHTTNFGAVAQFEGPGIITLGTWARAVTLYTINGGNTEVAQATFARARGTVTYTYTPGGPPLPEPASLTLALGGVSAMLGAARLRRRRRA